MHADIGGGHDGDGRAISGADDGELRTEQLRHVRESVLIRQYSVDLAECSHRQSEVGVGGIADRVEAIDRDGLRGGEVDSIGLNEIVGISQIRFPGQGHGDLATDWDEEVLRERHGQAGDGHVANGAGPAGDEELRLRLITWVRTVIARKGQPIFGAGAVARAPLNGALNRLGDGGHKIPTNILDASHHDKATVPERLGEIEADDLGSGQNGLIDLSGDAAAIECVVGNVLRAGGVERLAEADRNLGTAAWSVDGSDLRRRRLGDRHGLTTLS